MTCPETYRNTLAGCGRQSLTISHPLLRNFTLSGEIWHFTQPFLRSNAVGNLWAVSDTARKTLVFDVGFSHGLTHTSTQWEMFAGFTYLLPHRLWSEHALQRGTSGPQYGLSLDVLLGDSPTHRIWPNAASFLRFSPTLPCHRLRPFESE